jgi:Ca-activated chloride channel homolog
MKVTKLAAGSYRASIPIGSNEGLFRIRPALESKAFPEVGFYRQEAELLDFGSNPTLLKQIASGTGGIYFPSDNSGSVDLDRIFDSGGRSVPSSLQLWPGLLALAILLNLAELVLRKWRGLIEALRGKPEPGMLISQS